jgi:hypothetical protein
MRQLGVLRVEEDDSAVGHADHPNVSPGIPQGPWHEVETGLRLDRDRLSSCLGVPEAGGAVRSQVQQGIQLGE